ncbi:hypothetical protein BDV28DRAFT_138993 [Aspergillus coremiiformis]|uniref:Uncharacterized protein n=1 Tax=Aspergillus coremiiformis TaxID=138285 RepID=A0A5N6YYJ4_9EURO|nr:hypothetical protein BDV28DRAFT_138993 [Aspergillus coremiiformis]
MQSARENRFRLSRTNEPRQSSLHSQLFFSFFFVFSLSPLVSPTRTPVTIRLNLPSKRDNHN